MKDILYFNTLEDIKIVDMLRTTNKEKELPNLIILTILSAGAGVGTPIFNKELSEIGTKFILDGKEVTSDDFLIVAKSAFGMTYNFFGLLFEDSNEHILKISLINPSIPNFQKINTGPGYSANSVTSVIISSSITEIGEDAFRSCTGLTSITIPNSVTSIGKNAFSDCSGLTSMVVESGNRKYDSRNNCNAIIETATNTLLYGCMNTIIPNSVTSIGEWAFLRCSGLTSITIPNSVTSIGSSAFYQCSGLTSLNIPNSVTSIPAYCFYGCSSLTSVTIPNSVTSIGEFAFNGCSGLTKVDISDLAAWCSIDFYDYSSNPFYHANNLYLNGSKVTNLVIPSSVTTIKQYAFYLCTDLTSVTIPNSVTSIGKYAFYDCTGLTSVTIGNSVTSIGECAFLRCSGLTSITSLTTTAPTILSSTFQNIKTNGTLHVPAGSDYSTWMSTSNYYLGKYNWTKVEDA